jgi:beta-carotene hydroxylase
MTKRETMPVLPKKFREKSNFETLYLGMPLLIGYLVACAVSVYTYQTFFLSQNLWLKIVAFPILFISTTYTGLQFSDFSSFAHDGGHGTLHNKLSVSFLIGMLISSVIPGFLGVAYNQTHFPHHKYCNTENDLQAVWYSSHRIAKWPRFLSLCAFGALTYYYYAKDAFSYITGKGKVPNLSPRMSRNFAIINIVCNIAATFGWLVLLNYNPVWFTFCFLIPWLWTFVFFTHFVFTDHGNTGLSFQNSRTLTHPFARFLMGGNNYHLEHHLYPYVQRSKLHQLYLFLLHQDFYRKNGCIVDDKFWSVLTVAYTTDQPLIKNAEDEDWMPESA